MPAGCKFGELADRAAAVRWLADHPDLPDPGDDDQGDGSQGFLFHPNHKEPNPDGCRRRRCLEWSNTHDSKISI